MEYQDCVSGLFVGLWLCINEDTMVVWCCDEDLTTCEFHFCALLCAIVLVS